MHRRVYGELSMEDYQRVLRARGRGEKEGFWSRTKRAPRALVIGLLILSCYSAGATWQWDGKWSRSLTVDQATMVLQDASTTNIEARNALGRLRILIRKGVNELGSVASSDAAYSEDAAAYLQSTLEQAQELVR